MILSTKASGKAARRLPRWKCKETLFLLCAALSLGAAPSLAADGAAGLYRVDLVGLGSCYDADTSLMLAGHVFAYLAPGALEISFSNPPAGINAREEVILLGDSIRDFPARASRYLLQSALGKDVLLAFDANLRSPTGALLAYVYRREDGNCVNFTLIRDGLAQVAPQEDDFEFRAEFEMYQKQAMGAERGIWRNALGVQDGAVPFPVP